MQRDVHLKPEDLLGILTRPGFTTSNKVDRLAGRGIGLDLVNHDIENALGGTLSLSSRKNQGSRFSIHLPGQKDLLLLMVFQDGNHFTQLFFGDTGRIQNNKIWPFTLGN